MISFYDYSSIVLLTFVVLSFTLVTVSLHSRAKART